MAARAGWSLTAERVVKSPEGLDLPAHDPTPGVTTEQSSKPQVPRIAWIRATRPDQEEWSSLTRLQTTDDG